MASQGFDHLKESTTSLLTLLLVESPSQQKRFSLCLNGILHFKLFPLALLFCHWIPQRKFWIHFHTAPTPGIYTHLGDAPESSLLQGSPSSHLSWCDGCCWLFAGLSMSVSGWGVQHWAEQEGRIISPWSRALPNSWRTRDTTLPRAHLPFQGSWVNLSYLVLLLPLLSDPNPEINLMHLLINYHI